MSTTTRLLPWVLVPVLLGAAPSGRNAANPAKAPTAATAPRTSEPPRTPLPADGDWAGWVRVLSIPDARAKAEEALKAAGEKAHPALVAALGHDDWAVREAAGTFLASRGEKALPALVPALSNTDPEIASRALELVESIAYPRFNLHSWVGIRMSPEGLGVMVHEVLEGAPAEKAGFKPGDFVEKLDGKPLADAAGHAVPRPVIGPDGRVRIVIGEEISDPCMTLKERIARAPPGTKMTFSILRESKRMDLQARLAPMPDEMLEPEQQAEIRHNWEAWLSNARKLGKPPPLPGLAGPESVKPGDPAKPEPESEPAP